ncbi:uncharacterized protein cubi_01792 [Cryptosporidium ubiquitum]|uniref:Uncharacterized protein n=1 Tax=Cryptosporidium ubiquitum TaxID=857276 RepID=A0A1J4MEN0_9CRYT|nr:uncharacterized protein cubi_01792 [Cryptosporidium ubiquitum]OII71317.1 hypothetical protein cubi_01792 [Cryptosporidium ubiquitum]
MFEIKKTLANEHKETDSNKPFDELKELSFKRNQLIHGIVPNSGMQNNPRSNTSNGTTIIRKPYASKTPIHRQKPRHVPSFCNFTDSMNINFEKELFEKVSNETERNIIISHYEPGTIGLRRYAVTHQDEVDGYIFDFSKRSTRLSNDTMDRTVITVGFTGRKKRWTLCPSCDCIPKADKREKIVGQWKILYLPPKGGNLIVPRCVYEAYGDVVDDCNYFAATLCPQQTYCAKHSNQTSFLNRNWHYSYRHQFALQDYVVFCDHLQSVRLVWKLQVSKDNELNDITAEIAEKTLITVMQRFLEYARVNGMHNFFLSAPNPKYNIKDNSEESTPLNKACISDKDEKSNFESLQSCSSSESLSSQLDLSKIQLQFASQINSQVPISQFMMQKNSGVSFNPVINSLAQQSLYLHDFINYLDSTKKLDTSLTVERMKAFNVFSSSQNTSSIQMSDNLSNCSSAGTTPISIDCSDTPTMAHARMVKATINSSEDNGNSIKNSVFNVDEESQIIASNQNITKSRNLQHDLLESLRNSQLIGGSIQNICGINQSISLGNFSQVQFPQILHPTSTSGPYLILSTNSSMYPYCIPINHMGAYETQNALNNSSIINKQNNDSKLAPLCPLNSQINSEISVPFGISSNLCQPNNPNTYNSSKQNNLQNSTFSNEVKFVPQINHATQNITLLPNHEKIIQSKPSNPINTNAILKNGDNSSVAQ